MKSFQPNWHFPVACWAFGRTCRRVSLDVLNVSVEPTAQHHSSHPATTVRVGDRSPFAKQRKKNLWIQTKTVRCVAVLSVAIKSDFEGWNCLEQVAAGVFISFPSADTGIFPLSIRCEGKHLVEMWHVEMAELWAAACSCPSADSALERRGFLKLKCSHDITSRKSAALEYHRYLLLRSK